MLLERRRENPVNPVNPEILSRLNSWLNHGSWWLVAAGWGRPIDSDPIENQSTLTPLVPGECARRVVPVARSPAAPGRSLVIRVTTSAGSVTGGLPRYRPKNTR